MICASINMTKQSLRPTNMNMAFCVLLNIFFLPLLNIIERTLRCVRYVQQPNFFLHLDNQDAICRDANSHRDARSIPLSHCNVYKAPIVLYDDLFNDTITRYQIGWPVILTSRPHSPNRLLIQQHGRNYIPDRQNIRGF